MEVNTRKDNYYGDVRYEGRIIPRDTIDQATKCWLDISLDIFHHYKWGFLNDSSPPRLASFSQTPSFDEMIHESKYCLRSPEEIVSITDECQENLERYGVTHGEALELAQKFKLKIVECVEVYDEYMKTDNKLRICLSLVMVTVCDHDEYVHNRAILESSAEWEFHVCPASEEAVEALTKCIVAQDESVCTVCTKEFVKGEEVLEMPCTHFFHSNCLLPWLKNMNTCPNCRTKI